MQETTKNAVSRNEILEMLCPRCRNSEKRQSKFSTSLINKRGVVHDWYCHNCAYMWHIFYIGGMAIVIDDGVPGFSTDIVEGTLSPLGSAEVVPFLHSEALPERYDKLIVRYEIVNPFWRASKTKRDILQSFLDRLVFAQELLASGEVRQGMSQISMASSDLAKKLSLRKKSVDKMRELAALVETRREDETDENTVVKKD